MTPTPDDASNPSDEQDIPWSAFGAAIARWRSALGLTQEEVGLAAGRDPNTVGKAERGERTSLPTLRRIAGALGHPKYQDLLGPPPDPHQVEKSPPGRSDPSRPDFATQNGCWSRGDCEIEFGYWNHERQSRDPLSIDAIAIDFDEGWYNIARAINTSKANQITIRVAMLTDDFDRIEGSGAIPSIVRRWCASGRANLQQVRTEFPTFGLSIAREKSVPVSMEVRHYVLVPSINGSRLRQGESTRHFITRCYTVPGVIPEFRWGDDHYSIVSRESATGELLDRAVAFNEAFDSLWNHPKTTLAFRWPEPLTAAN
jgi:transcriptional regulator with XRE-family HTH domain